jgi:BirA family transcriptional regulator, biotin operon repressor / biotin---[acetyl-CoA-carboxylase] ligase
MSALDTALLTALRSSSVHLPGGELASTLHTTRNIIAERIAELRGAGFEIDERPGLGYRLVAAPDRLIADDLRARLGSSRFIRDILVFAETDSTNERALQLGTAGALGGLAIFAEKQNAGRGRFGRRWESTSHLGLWFSLLVRPDLPLTEWTRLTTWTAVTLAEAVEETTSLAVQIKWPNDLEIAGRKVAGVLIETATDHAGSPFGVVGIGLNVNHSMEDFPGELNATSLGIASRRRIDRPALAAAILRRFSGAQPRLGEAFPDVIAFARRRSSLLGRRVAVQAGGTRVEGMAADLDEAGRLLLRLADGRIDPLGAGEASVIREP